MFVAVRYSSSSIIISCLTDLYASIPKKKMISQNCFRDNQMRGGTLCYIGKRTIASSIRKDLH